jgi:hypothetical protein
MSAIICHFSTPQYGNLHGLANKSLFPQLNGGPIRQIPWTEVGSGTRFRRCTSMAIVGSDEFRTLFGIATGQKSGSGHR